MAEQTNPPSAGVEQGAALSVEQRIANLYGANITSDAPEPPPQAAPEAPAAEPEQAEGQADELTPDDIPDEVESEAPQPQTDEFEIVHNGQQKKLTRAETIELAQKGFDYTSKTQALAEQQKQAAQLIQGAQEVAALEPMLADERAVVKSAEAALKPWQNVDWVALATNEPLEYPRYRAQYDQLVQAYNTAAGQYHAKSEWVNGKKKELQQQILATEAKTLRERIPAWTDPKRFESDVSQVRAYLKEKGVPDEQIESLNQAVMVEIAYEGMQYRKLVKSKAEKSKQMRQAPPTTRPGAIGTTESAEQQKVKQLRQNLKKTGDWRDAASLLSRLK